ncbi:MAG: phosphatidylinositol-specific phospholipase C domain-containing protein [Deltaproteobacteria bacterium]|nr:phosphatidylinositol-specific phospholipase C domain-containing protein [Deltaproteobacteria bacterium]
MSRLVCALLVTLTLSGCPSELTPPEPDPDPTPAPRACNGDAALCGLPVDEVAFLRTHNSHASEERGYSQLSWNHYNAMPTQLTDGVRAVNMDVYLYEGQMVVCHGYCTLGLQRLDLILAELTDFLAANPDEVVLLSLQNEAPWADTLASLEAAGVGALGYSHTPGAPWPTLEEMLDGGTPLLISAGGTPAGAPDWLHRDGDLSWGDHWGAETPDDLDCEAENAPFDGGLYFFNNVLTAPIASPDLANQVNHDPDLSERLQACGAENGQIPNIISVDFYSLGDTLEAVRRLNLGGIE